MVLEIFIICQRLDISRSVYFNKLTGVDAMNSFGEFEMRELQIEQQQIDEDFAELDELFCSEKLSFSTRLSEDLNALYALLEDSDVGKH
jgi:hypothetical protein